MRYFFFLLWITLCCPAFATISPCDATQSNPCTVLDTENNPQQVKNWRYLKIISNYYLGDLSGIEKLNISGSAAPSEAGWSEVKRLIEEVSPEVKNIFVVDLRQEIHGYLNNDSATLMILHNWINLGKSAELAHADEVNWLAHIQSPLYVLLAKDFKIKDYDVGKYLPITSVLSEQEVVENLGMKYLRFNVTDHMFPLDDEVDRLIDVISAITPEDWLHIHCRGGEGRTVTFFAMYDMLRNADQVSFYDIIKRQASIPPYYDLSDFNHSDPELTVFYELRYGFLQMFYQYAQARLKGDQRTWTAFKKSLPEIRFFAPQRLSRQTAMPR